ncbi:formate/nitrite transporter family protein, partial [Acinetobacter baumannii]
PREKREVQQRKAVAARVVHEVVRLQGIEELERPIASLLWSGIAAGLAIGLSVLGVAALTVALPPSPMRNAIADMGYALGFVVVILGRLQL